MTVITLVSAHGSPGVTTTALALAATWPESRRCLLVEADTYGGVIAARYGLSVTPGLGTLAAHARRGIDTATVEEHTQRLPGGLPVLFGPATPEEVNAVWRDLSDPLLAWAATQGDLDLIVDRGRLPLAAPHSVKGIDGALTFLVTRPSVDQLRPAGIRLAALKVGGVEASLLLVGDEPYGLDVIAATMKVTVAGVIAWDPRTAAFLTGAEGAVRDVRRSALVRSAATFAGEVARQLQDREQTGAGNVVALSDVREAGG